MVVIAVDASTAAASGKHGSGRYGCGVGRILQGKCDGIDIEASFPRWEHARCSLLWDRLWYAPVPQNVETIRVVRISNRISYDGGGNVMKQLHHDAVISHAGAACSKGGATCALTGVAVPVAAGVTVGVDGVGGVKWGEGRPKDDPFGDTSPQSSPPADDSTSGSGSCSIC